MISRGLVIRWFKLKQHLDTCVHGERWASFFCRVFMCEESHFDREEEIAKRTPVQPVVRAQVVHRARNNVPMTGHA